MVGAVAEVIGGVALVLTFCQLRVKFIQVFFDGRVVVYIDGGNVVVSVVGVNQPKPGPVGLVVADVSEWGSDGLHFVHNGLCLRETALREPEGGAF